MARLDKPDASTRPNFAPYTFRDPATGNIGTSAADDAVANTAPGEADYAWVGGSRKLYEHQGTIATIEIPNGAPLKGPVR